MVQTRKICYVFTNQLEMFLENQKNPYSTNTQNFEWKNIIASKLFEKLVAKI